MSSIVTAAMLAAVMSIGSTVLVAHGADTDITDNSTSGNSAPVVTAVSAGPALTEEQQWVLQQEIEEAKYNATVAAAVADAKEVQDSFILSSSNSNTVRVAGPGTSTKVTASYAAVTRNDVNATIITPKNDAAADLLSETVKAEHPAAAMTEGPLKVQMYVKGDTIWDGFGTYNMTVEVGKMYNGRNATVYQILKSGEIVSTPAVVANGVVPVSMTEMGSVMVVVD